MPTKISQIFDALKAIVVAELPSGATGYKQIPNPYIPDANSQLLLKRGYGIGIGPAEPKVLELCPKYGMERIFSIILVNVVTSQENDGPGFETLQKALLEDWHLLRKALESEVTLATNPPVCIKNDFVSDSGIIALSGEQGKFISISGDWSVIYRENLD